MKRISKLLLLITTLSLLTFSSGFSLTDISDIEFDDDVHTLLSDFHPDDRAKIFMMEGDWYLAILQAGAELSGDNYARVYKFSDTWINQGNWQQTCVDASGCQDIDCNFIPNAYEGNVIECVASEDDGNGGGAILRWRLDTTSWTVLDTYPYTTLRQLNLPAVANDYLDTEGNILVQHNATLKWWQKWVTDTDPVFTYNNELGGSGAGQGSWTLPDPYDDPDDLQVAWCNGFYHLIYRRSFGGTPINIYDAVYDDHLTGASLNQENYTGNIYTLMPLDYNVGVDEYGVWVDRRGVSGDFLNLVMVNYTNDLMFIQRWSCNDDGTISFVDSQELSTTEIEPTANRTANRYIRYPFLTQNNMDVWHLLYTWYDNGNWTVKVIVEEGVCFEGTWTPLGICDGTYEKFSRVCSPTGCCNATVKWEITQYCIDEQGAETCSPDWVCIDGDTKAYQQLDCTYVNETNCTGGTPFCFDGECVAECDEAYFCYDDITRCYKETNCQISECVDCNSTGYGYCYDARCYEIQRPAFDPDASTLDIIEDMSEGVKGMLSWISPPLFKILLAIAIMLLILGVFGLVAKVGEKAV